MRLGQAATPHQIDEKSGCTLSEHCGLGTSKGHRFIGFKDILQVDGYGGYKVLAKQGDVRLAFCWSHVRRKFYELANPGPALIAAEALTCIAAPSCGASTGCSRLDRVR